MTTPGVYDVLLRYYLSKIPDASIKPSTFSQTLISGKTLGTGGINNSLTLGSPDTITLFLRSDTAGSWKISLSPDGVDWYHDTQYDTAVTGTSEKVFKVPGASFILIVPSTSFTTATVRFQANYS